MKIAVVGATGMVGKVMLQVLAERGIPVSELIPVASEKSIGQQVEYKGENWPVLGLETALKMKPQVALFSAGGETSKIWAPKFANAGCTVIDNSSAWRMTPGIPLVVPEINANILTKEDKIIANPNCSTIQLVMAVYPLHQRFGLKRMIVSTYQSVSGTGKAAVDQLDAEVRGEENPTRIYPHPIFKNAIPQCDSFDEEGYTKEELKLMREPKKIMATPEIRITATAVRIPVQGGHSEAVNLEFDKEFDLEEVRAILSATPGVTVLDNPKESQYPMCLHSEGKDDVFVGRLRKDIEHPNTLNLWIVADNLRKGAATNAVQILDYLIEQNLV